MSLFKKLPSSFLRSLSSWRALGPIGLVSLAACASQPPPPVEDATAQQEQREAEERLTRLDDQNEQLQSRVRELESRLHLARAEVQELRDADEARRNAAADREVVRIGHHTPQPVADDDWDVPGADEDSWEVVGEPEPADDASGPRPVLRLYGSPAANLDTSTPLVIPPAPPGVPSSLPVVAGGDPVFPPPARAARAVSDERRRPQPTDDPAIARYREALRALSARRFEEALRGFDAFLRARPDHPYAPSAIYWQGEVHYAMRDYGQALTHFARVVSRHPRANKAPDALFKMGMCHQRMGREAAARRFFERVRREHPDSVAARLAAQEDA